MHGVVPQPHIYLHGLMLNCHAQGQIGFYCTSRPILFVFFTVGIFPVVNYFILNDVTCILKACNTFRLFLRWSRGEERPPNGSLVHLVTKNYTTELLLV